MKHSDAHHLLLCRPLFVIALAIWAVNDHVIKYALPRLAQWQAV